MSEAIIARAGKSGSSLDSSEIQNMINNAIANQIGGGVNSGKLVTKI